MSNTGPSEFFFFLGHAFYKRAVYAWCLGILLVLVGACCAFGYYLHELNEVEVAKLKAREALTEGSKTQGVTSGATQADGDEEEESEFLVPDTIENLIQNHRLASGFGGIKSYMLVGTFGIDVGKTEIHLKALAPNFYKFKTEYLDHGLEVEYGYNGEQIWLELDTSTTSGEFGAFKQSALVESSLTHLAWCHDTSQAFDHGLDSILELRPEEHLDGRDYCVVRSRKLLPIEMDHYIDKETYLEVFRQAILTDSEGKTSHMRVEYDLPDEHAEYRLPIGYRIFKDDKLTDIVKFDKIKVNQTIFEAVFNPPGEL
ncbi:MAG: hypothetical protein ACSHX8_05745 [Opitutaceae bacterium]